MWWPESASNVHLAWSDRGKLPRFGVTKRAPHAFPVDQTITIDYYEEGSWPLEAECHVLVSRKLINSEICDGGQVRDLDRTTLL